MQYKAPTSEKPLPVLRYSANSSLNNPLSVLSEVVCDLWKYRELTWILFTRDLKAQYRQSYLGYLWLFVPVISTTVIWMFLNSTKVIQVAETPIPYPAFVLIGSMIWSVFTASVNQPLASFQAGRAVFTKLKVPAEAFILSGLSKIVFDLLIRMLVLIPVFLILKMSPAGTAWLFPMGMICAAVIGLSIGYLLLPLGALYSDISRLASTLLGFCMYLTPVVYPPAAAGFAKTLNELNPMTAVVVTTRDWLTLGSSSYTGLMLAWSALAFFGLAVGLVIFRIVTPHLVERLGM